MLFDQSEAQLGLADLFVDALYEMLLSGALLPCVLHRGNQVPDDIIPNEAALQRRPIVFRRKQNRTLLLNRAAVESIIETIASDLQPTHVLRALRQAGMLGSPTNQETFYAKLQIRISMLERPVRFPVLQLQLPGPLFGLGEQDPFDEPARRGW